MKTNVFSPFTSVRRSHRRRSRRLSGMLIAFFIAPLVSFAQIDSSRFQFEGKTRDYIVFLPHGYDGIKKMPVVFNLHGYTLDKNQQMNYSQMNPVADTAGVIVVYPNAIDATWSSGVSAFNGRNDVGFIDALIDTLDRHYSIDRDRIYSCGFSNGGMMSNRLASELSKRITAIASVRGAIAQSIANGRSAAHVMPMLVIHGTADGIVPYNGAYDWLSVEQTLNHWIRFNQCIRSDTASLPDIDITDDCTVAKINYYDCYDSTLMTFYKVNGGGHSWPGGDVRYLRLTWGNIGQTDGDFNASAEIVKFFKSYKLSDFTITGVTADLQPPAEFSLLQNYPNPFNPMTTIGYRIADAGTVTLKVYDVLGREVAALVNEEKRAGAYEAAWDAKNISSGIYFYQLSANGRTLTKRMAVLR